MQHIDKYNYTGYHVFTRYPVFFGVNDMEKVRVTKFGDTAGIIIPDSILKELKNSEGDTLLMEVKDGVIVLHKKFKHRTLKERMAEYDGKIETLGFEWGEPVGREML